MERERGRVSCRTCLVAAAVMISGEAYATEPSAQVVGEGHAKSIAVMRLSTPSQGYVTSVSLAISTDGESFTGAQAGVPREESLLTSVTYSQRHTTILVPVVGQFGMGREQFLFSECGTYYLRWGIGFENKDIQNLKVYQTVKVKQALASDVSMLAELSDWELLRELSLTEIFDNFPEDARQWVRSGKGADFRALVVIGELLQATRADEPGDVVSARGGLENALRWADALLPLAQELPESSYASYVAYYAGCCYVAALGEENNERHKEIVSAAGKESPYYGKAKEALSLAVERADAYLKPRAIYYLAFLYLCSAEFDRVDKSLDEALELGGKQGTIQKIVDKLRNGTRAAGEKRAAEDAPKSQP